MRGGKRTHLTPGKCSAIAGQSGSKRRRGGGRGRRSGGEGKKLSHKISIAAEMRENG